MDVTFLSTTYITGIIIFVYLINLLENIKVERLLIVGKQLVYYFFFKFEHFLMSI